jgi:hypothetical protein
MSAGRRTPDFTLLFKTSLNSCAERIAFFGEIGSSSEGRSQSLFSDIDVVCVFSDPPHDDKANLSIYGLYLELTKQLQLKILAEHNMTYHVFPTFRIEDLLRYALHTERRSMHTHRLVHMLVYPSWFHLFKWESNSLAKNIMRTAELQGQCKVAISELFDPESFEDRIQPVVSLLYETLRLLECSLLPEKILEWEVSHKLYYIIKHLTAEMLIEEGHDKREAYLWQTMERLPTLKIGGASSIVSEAIRIRTASHLPSLRRARTLAVDVSEYLREALKVYSDPRGLRY